MSARKNRIPEIGVGTVVRSTDGRDRKRPFLVVEMDEANRVAPAVIADGSLRKLEDRKHKNPAHLCPLGAIGEADRKRLSERLTDSEIAEICKRFDKS